LERPIGGDALCLTVQPQSGAISPSRPGLRALIAPGVLVGILNLLGYAAGWFQTVSFYDEMVHALTSFWLGLVGWRLWRLRARDEPPQLQAFLVIAGTMLTAGLMWEFFEAAVSLIGTRWDTLIDLALDWLGGAAAGLFAVLDLRRLARRTMHADRLSNGGDHARTAAGG
jgi:hypothetical protein